MDISQFLKEGHLDARWYKIPGTEVEVQIRNLKPHRRSHFVRQCTIKKTKRGRLTQDVDDKRLNELYIRECIVGWKNIEDDGKPFPFSPENAILLDQHWPEFNALWNSVIEDLSTIAEEVQETEEGNSESGEGST